MVLDSIYLVLVGDSDVGKTTLWYQIGSPGKIFDGKAPHIFDFMTPMFEIDGKQILMHPQDTPGSDDFDRLRPLSYGNADVVMICFDVANRYSLENVTTKWVQEVRHHKPKVPIILVGTKKDLRDDAATISKLQENNQEPVKTEEGKAVAKEIGATMYLECSCKTAECQKVFDEAIRVVLRAKGLVEPAKKSKCSVS